MSEATRQEFLGYLESMFGSDEDSPLGGIEHLDGVAWCDAPPPPKKHKHWAQTYGFAGSSLHYVRRCACGAFGNPDGTWTYLDKPRVTKSWWQR